MAILTRRRALGALGAAGVGLLGLRWFVPRWLRAGPVRPIAELGQAAQALVRLATQGLRAERVIDLHVHVAGLGGGGSGCWIHPRLRSHLHPLERLRFELYLGAAGVVRADEDADRLYWARLCELLDAGVPGVRLLLLAFDLAVREDGSEDRGASMFHVPNEYVCALAESHPGFLACASVHPYRADALQRLEQARDAGAVAVKWLPNAMGIDPLAPRCLPFYEKLVELGMPLLVHTGEERAVWVEGAQEFGNPLRLRAPLEAGATVVALHCGSLGEARDLDRPGAVGDAPVSAFELFLRVLQEAGADGRFFGEISALTQINREPEILGTLLSGSAPQGRLLYGSDYPLVAIDPLTSLRRIVGQGFLDAEEREPLGEIFRANPLLFDLVLKRRLTRRSSGEEHRFGPEVFESARLFDKL